MLAPPSLRDPMPQSKYDYPQTLGRKEMLWQFDSVVISVSQ